MRRKRTVDDDDLNEDVEQQESTPESTHDSESTDTPESLNKQTNNSNQALSNHSDDHPQPTNIDKTDPTQDPDKKEMTPSQEMEDDDRQLKDNKPPSPVDDSLNQETKNLTPNGERKNLQPNGDQNLDQNGQQQDDPKKDQKKRQQKLNAAKNGLKALHSKPVQDAAKGLYAAEAIKDGLHAGKSWLENTHAGIAVHEGRKQLGKFGHWLGDFKKHPVKALKSGAQSAKHMAKGAATKVGHVAGNVVKKTGEAIGHVSKAAGSALTKLGATMTASAAKAGTVVMLGTAGVAGGGAIIGQMVYNEDYAPPACTTQPMSTGQQGVLTGNPQATGGTVDGMNMDNLKKVYDFLIQNEGFSGAAAAGAVGNAAQESHGDPKIINPTNHNVAGLMQWGCGGGNGARFFNGGFIKQGDTSTWTVENECKLIDWELHHSYPSQAKKYAQMDDPAKAAVSWCDWYEGAPGQDEDKRAAFATQFYKEWNGAGTKANPDKFNSFGLGGSNDADANAGTNDAIAQNLQADVCGNGKNGSTGSVADGTGAIAEHPAGGFTSYDWNDYPADMKQYVPNPEKLGMKWGSPQGWSQEGGGGGQCFDFAVSYFHLIWKGAPATLSGNGKDAANNEASAMHGKVTNTPHAGAICSTPANVPHVAPGQYGHTFVVVHVLANGDIILLQQNFTHSGDNVGKKNTWEVGLCSKEEYQKYNFMFFTPDNQQPNFG